MDERGIDVRFSRKPQKGKFRLVGVDTFDHGDWVVGDYETLAEALKVADEKTNGQQMLMMHIYDKNGKHVSQCGRF